MSSFEATKTWTPPAHIEDLFANAAGNQWASINRPTAGAREDKEVPVGSASLQLYSLATPNGQKVSIMLEELGIDYDAHVISIGKGDQFTSGFVSINPNSKIPAAVDHSTSPPTNIFESGSILLYLAEKYGRFLSSNPAHRVQTMNWLFWQMGGLGPMCGNYGHFMVYAPDDKVEARNYGVARYGMEVQRLCDVLNQALEGKLYLVNDELSIADFAIFPWYQQLRTGYKHPSGINAAGFLGMDKYTNANAWADRILAREAVTRGMTVCSNGVGKPWLIQSSK